MNKYQVIKVDTGDVFETYDLTEAAKEVSMTKREIEEAGYYSFQIVFRALGEDGVEKFAEVHRYEDKRWESVVVIQDSLAIDAKEKPSESAKEKPNESGLSKEKIYYDAKFGHKGLSYRLSTETFRAYDGVVETVYRAEFGEDKLEISKREYEFLLRELEVKD